MKMFITINRPEMGKVYKLEKWRNFLPGPERLFVCQAEENLRKAAR